MKEEMDFELIIGDLNQYFPDPLIKTARYYSRIKVIAVDHWTGEEEEAYMADVLSHEFCHHLLNTKFDRESGVALDNIRGGFNGIPETELNLINKKGIEEAWAYLSPVVKFALKCSVLWVEDDVIGNGVI
ncbi:MAG TPA: hypothetical protein VEP90_05500 [Methylomirabilota bacterium]|nr:hypothetical protein [Methylomirabilota bacterium]